MRLFKIAVFLFKKVWHSRFPVFILVGIVNTVFSYLMFSLFIFLKLHYTLAALLSTILGILFNFKTTGSIVFKNKNNKLFFRFAAVCVVLYFANISLVRFFHWLYPNYYLAGALSAAFLAVFSFLLSHFWVFKGVHRQDKAEEFIL